MEILVAPDYRLFVLFLALNAHGYDLEGDPAMHPVRLGLREAVRHRQAGAPAPAAEALWFELTKPPWPRVSLCEAYALHQAHWPSEPGGSFGPGCDCAFAAWLQDQLLELPIEPPGDLLAGLGELGPILDSFAARTGAAELWSEVLARHLEGTAAMQEAAGDLLRSVETLLCISSWPFESIRVVPNLLQSRWLADQYLIGGTLWSVVASADPDLAGSVIHEAVHMVIRPALRPLMPELEALTNASRSAGSTAALAALMEPIGYWGPAPGVGLYRAVQEALVRAVIILATYPKGAERGAAARRGAEQGFVMMEWLVAELERVLPCQLDGPRLLALTDGILAVAERGVS